MQGIWEISRLSSRDQRGAGELQGDGGGALAESALGLVPVPVQGLTAGWGRADKWSLSLMGPALSTAFRVQTHS